MDDRKKILFIVNPISGNGKKLPLYHAIRSTIDRDKFDISIQHTKHAGHASEITQKAVEEGFDIVVAVGGDGTVNEVARSLVHTNTALGIIPCGSGNGLARHLHIPLNSRKALKVINECVIHSLDYGRIDDRPFFCTCGMGYDADVSMAFANAGRRGLRTYVEKGFLEGIRYKPQPYTVESDDGTHHYKAFLIACANASQYGNNAYIAPLASMKDGLLDIVIMEPFNKLLAPKIAVQLFRKTLPRNSHIRNFQARRIHITRPQEGPIHADGDPFMAGREITVEIVPQSLLAVVNPKKHNKD